MKERIKQVRGLSSLSQTAFAEKLGVTRDIVANWENGRVDVPEVVIRSICREFNVDYAWLKTGEGSMLVEPSIEADMDLIDSVMSGEDEFAKSFFRAFARKSPEEWRKLREDMQSILDEAAASEAQKK